mmetsp:Transcript_68807/g.136390  ORF Transcript_68807/g.136390 Transcript_68807/m.136390 type:complete len:214 (-) Transcript_68807:509-1150(-)
MSRSCTSFHIAGPNMPIITIVCRLTLMSPLPMSVAPKKVQKGISSHPHAMPHMSKAALGHEARSRIPMKPFFSVNSIVFTLSQDTKSPAPSAILPFASSSSASKSVARPPERLAARVMKKGGSSPMAVPEPQTMTQGKMRRKMLQKSSEPSSLEMHFMEHSWLYAAAKLVDLHSCALVMIVTTCGQRNMMPECRPVPKPIEERMPSMSHQATS